MSRNLMIGAAALALCFAMPSVQAETVKFTAKLTGADEVPATDSKGTGKASLKYDTDSKSLTYKVTYKGLTGDATAAHFHGPADPGVSAGVEVPIEVTKSPIKGSATLTDDQAGDLMAGKWYVNVHTAANPKGEIRGQVVKK